jgi:3-phenylpropionate/trans-cinnamate dioxygenase ferredoxin component
MSFVPVCSLEDLTQSTPRLVVVDGVAVSVVRVGDEVFAINDVCSHGAVSLSEGEVDGCAVECWLHGSRFDLRTGAALSLPATEPVAVYPVKVEDGKVLVSLEES